MDDIVSQPTNSDKKEGTRSYLFASPLGINIDEKEDFFFRGLFLLDVLEILVCADLQLIASGFVGHDDAMLVHLEG